MQALVIEDGATGYACRIEDVEPHQRDDTDVLVRVEYSGINFKDVMVASPKSRVRRVARLVGGVDAAGTVVETSVSFRAGERVAVHGGDLGVARDGGFAEYLYAPPGALARLPDSMSTRAAMVIGTAGFTSMASILALEHHGLSKDGPVLVTGATGGVGSQAVRYLALRGYHVVASSGSARASEWLKALGAAELIGRDDIADRLDRVLASERWDGAIDCVGGATLASILRSLRYGAAVAASGLVASAELATTVYPFITRAVSLLGIDAVHANEALRTQVWQELGAAAPRVNFEELTHRIVTLEQLGDALEEVRAGSTRGRTLVDVTGGARRD